MARRSVPTGPSASIVKVTPAKATQWLELNHINRPLKPARFTYQRDMAAGNWQVTGEAIKFANDGSLIDGQNRLWAVIASGRTVEMFVVTGLDPDAQSVMDAGVKRSAADAVGLNGYKHSVSVAAVARLAINYEAGLWKDAEQSRLANVSHSEILHYIKENPDLEPSIDLSVKWAAKMLAPGAPVNFSFYILQKLDFAQASDYFTDLAESRTSGEGDPRYAVLRRFNEIQRNRQKVRSEAYVHFLFVGWNAIRAGKTVSLIRTHWDGKSLALAVPK